MIRLLKKAMQLVCLALMLVVLMAVVSVASAERRDPVHQLSAGRKYLPWNLVQAGR